MLKFKKIKNNLVHTTAVINWKMIVIGSGNIIGPYVVIGNNAQHPKLKSNGIIQIGNNNVFNEFTNVHLPTNIKKKTIIGNNNYFMNSTTIDHDCTIEDNVILSSNVILGGNVRVGLEDNLYLKKGVLASNGQLVEKAARIVDDLGAKILNPEEVREKLKLKKHF